MYSFWKMKQISIFLLLVRSRTQVARINYSLPELLNFRSYQTF